MGTYSLELYQTESDRVVSDNRAFPFFSLAKHKILDPEAAVKLALIILGNLFSIVGLIAFVKSVLSQRKSVACKNWPRVTGTISKSKRGADQGNDAIPLISYEYSIEESKFVGTTINFHPIGYDVRSTNDVLKKYPVGSEVDVFFDPHNHQNSVLEAGGETFKGMLYSHLFSLAFFGLGLIMLCLAATILD